MFKFLIAMALMLVLAYAVLEMFLMAVLGQWTLALAFLTIALLALYGALRVSE